MEPHMNATFSSEKKPKKYHHILLEQSKYFALMQLAATEQMRPNQCIELLIKKALEIKDMQKTCYKNVTDPG